MNVKWASIYVLLLLFRNVYSWKGQVCSRLVSSWGLEKRCAYWNWSGPCYHWRSVMVNKYIPQKFCCDGWRTSTHQNCDRAICRPECQNGGSCVSPGVCSCVEGWRGSRCEKE